MDGKYNELARSIVESEDPGSEVADLLAEIDKVACRLDKFDRIGILIVQAVPEDESGNPIIHISVFANRETDFPLESDEKYIKWVGDYYESIKDMGPQE